MCCHFLWLKRPPLTSATDHEQRNYLSHKLTESVESQEISRYTDRLQTDRQTDGQRFFSLSGKCSLPPLRPGWSNAFMFSVWTWWTSGVFLSKTAFSAAKYVRFERTPHLRPSSLHYWVVQIALEFIFTANVFTYLLSQAKAVSLYRNIYILWQQSTNLSESFLTKHFRQLMVHTVGLNNKN